MSQVVMNGRFLREICRLAFATIALLSCLAWPLSASAQEAEENSEANEESSETPKMSAEEAIAQAKALQEQGDHKSALAIFERILRIAPGEGVLHMEVGRSLQALGEYERAAEAYSKAIQFGFTDFQVYNGRGVCFLEQASPQPDLAMSDFENALKANRSDADAQSNMGHVLAQYGQDMESALRYLDEALAQRENARDYRDRGTAKARLQEYEEAVADLESSIKLDPDDHETYSMLAQVHAAQEDYAGVIDSITKAIDRYEPKRRTQPKILIEGYLRRAQAHLSLGNEAKNDDERTRQFEAVVADSDALLKALGETAFPDIRGQAYFHRGVAFRMLDRYGEAIDSLTRAIQAAATSAGNATYLAEAYLRRGICWFYQDYNDLARGDFEAAAATGTGFSDARIPLWIGYTYHKDGEYRQAIESYSEAIAKKENFPLPHVNKGRAYFALKDYDKAIRSFNDAIRVETSNAEHYYLRGLCNVEQGELEKARESFKLALLKENRSPKMYLAMADVLEKLGNADLAGRWRQQAGSMGDVKE